MKPIRLTPLTSSVKSTIDIPGSKSYTNRALLMAALTKGAVEIQNPLFSDDTQAMIECLQKLGIKIEVEKDKVVVVGDISKVKKKEYVLNANLSGTTLRFLTALCCLVPGVKYLEGEEGLNKRPVGDLVDGLTQMGAQIEYVDKEGFPPLKISSSKLTPGVTKLNGDVSSQFFSAILMVSPQVGDITIKVLGNQISKPYIDMTIDTMRVFGADVENKNYKSYLVAGNQKYSLGKYIVEGDFSSAGYFFAIAALTKSTLILRNLNSKSKQADLGFVHILEKMDNVIVDGKSRMIITGSGIQPINVDMEHCPDQVQTLAVLAAFAKGVTRISGVRSLRVKETERVKALQTELLKMGIKTESSIDTLTIYGGDPKPATIETYGDHRMAMAFAVAGAKLEGMVIKNPEVVNKTFPDFWKKYESLNNKP